MTEHFLVTLERRTRLTDLSQDLGATETQLLFQIQDLLQSAVSTFGIRPFLLEFDGRNGWTILPSSCVGFIGTESLSVVLKSKIPDLALEKIVAMAQGFGDSVFRVGSASVQAGLDAEANMGALELLAMSLVDVCIEIRRGGLDFRFQESNEGNRKLRGTVDISESIQQGRMRPPIAFEEEMSHDTEANRFVRAALTQSSRLSLNGTVKSAVTNELAYWSEGISENDIGGDELRNLRFSFSYPRSDYQRAIVLSLAIMSGLALDLKTTEFGVPQVLFDLDVLFETFCTEALAQLLPSSIYEVSTQNKYDHPATPPIRGYFKPDIVVRNRVNGNCIVVDVKNKYSVEVATGEQQLQNTDIFQLCYYSESLNAVAAMLLYPATRVTASYPIKGSEGEAKYREKVDRFLEVSSSKTTSLHLGGSKVNLVAQQIDLSGNLLHSMESLASAASYIDFLLTKDTQ